MFIVTINCNVSLNFEKYKDRRAGTIGDFLRENNIPYEVIELESEPIPDTAMFDTLVIMGGPMSVNESDTYTS